MNVLIVIINVRILFFSKFNPRFSSVENFIFRSPPNAGDPRKYHDSLVFPPS